MIIEPYIMLTFHHISPNKKNILFRRTPDFQININFIQRLRRGSRERSLSALVHKDRAPLQLLQRLRNPGWFEHQAIRRSQGNPSTAQISRKISCRVGSPPKSQNSFSMTRTSNCPSPLGRDGCTHSDFSSNTRMAFSSPTQISISC